MTDSRAVTLAYRLLYRRGLQAIRYSTPARHVLLRILRSSFRSGSRDDFDPKKIARTLDFLQRASESKGLEHSIIKNLITVRYWEQPQIRRDVKVIKEQDVKHTHLRRSANAHFNSTLILLNESLGICLR